MRVSTYLLAVLGAATIFIPIAAAGDDYLRSFPFQAKIGCRYHQGSTSPGVSSLDTSEISLCTGSPIGTAIPLSRDSASSAPLAEPQAMTLKKVFLNLPGDQWAIWTSPAHFRWKDSSWVFPLVGTSAVLIASDQHSMQRVRSNSLAIRRSNNISDGGLAGISAVPAFMYAWGSLRGLPRQRETGLLAGEAMIDSLAVNEGLKLVFQRERPTPTGGQGRFFQGILDSSFPSTHAMLSWTAASVLVHEYPGSLTQILAYGAATTVSVARVTGRQHFPADVVVGAAAGWLIGHQVYKSHHDPDIDDLAYGSFSPDPKELDSSKLGSVFVPLDSWVYPALKRLAALGYIDSQFIGLQPWSRRECARQIEIAEFFAQDLPPESSVAQTIKLLKSEFSRDGQHFQSMELESAYVRSTTIAGSPLRDSYHFGQTLWNDFGRPYDQGQNIVTGGTVSGVSGPFFFSARGEYQHAPGRAALTDAQRSVIAGLDQNPLQPASPVSSIDRFYPLDIYGGVQLGQYAVSFGKQSMWLGPGETAPLMLSDNADPMYTLRLSRTTPLELPGILHWLGSVRGELLFSKLSGHQFPARPFFNLQKISFHPTKNLEIGFTRASLWAGVGHPFTFRALARNLGKFNDSAVAVFDPNDPGDRKSGFDFSYRVPGLRNWLTLYGDFFSEDDPSPIANPRRAAINPGLYVSHLPMISKLDLRVEATSTESLTALDRGGTFMYFSSEYHDANTNKGMLFGNPTGRDGRSYQAWSTYHFSAVNELQVGYKQVKASSAFLPGGATQSDATTRWQWQIHPNLRAEVFLQYERWLVPVVKSSEQNDVSGQVQLTFTPHWHVHAD